jgi:hypothetical protein
VLLTYYTLARLAAEWDVALCGGRILEAWSQQRDELSLAVEGRGDETSTLVVVARPDRRLLFRNRSHGRARRHTASLFQDAEGSTIARIRNSIGNRGAPWLILALLAGLAARSVLFGATFGVVATMSGLLGWYLVTVLVEVADILDIRHDEVTQVALVPGEGFGAP